MTQVVKTVSFSEPSTSFARREEAEVEGGSMEMEEHGRRERRNLRKEDEKEEFSEDFPTKPKFNFWKEAVLMILTFFYLLDIALDTWVSVRFFSRNHPRTAWFVVFCILLPNTYAGYKSLQWYLRAHDLEPIRTPITWIIRVAFFPISLVLRYYDTWKYGHLSKLSFKEHDRVSESRFFSAFLIEAAEASMLRLFTIFLQDAPIAVVNLKEVLNTPPEVQKYKMEMILVVIFKLLFTMTLGVVHFVSSSKAVYHSAKTDGYIHMGTQFIVRDKEDNWERKGLLSLKAEICIYLWHLCSMGSRIVAYALFICPYQQYLYILVGIRWIINTIWIKCDAWEITMTNCVAFGGVYLFSFVPTSPKRQLIRVLGYYLLTTIENVVIVVLFSQAMPKNPYAEGSYAFVFGGMAASMVFMALYYGFFHPSRTRKSSVVQWFNQRTRA